MSFAAFLTHTCTIQRATNTTDAYNNKVETWNDVATLVPCRFTEKRKNVFISEIAEQAVVAAPLLLVGAEVDLRDRDRITHIVIEDGIVLDRAFVITSLLTRRGKGARHKSAILSDLN